MKKPGMRFTVYLPDDIGQEAKAAGINMSGTFRHAVERELRGDAVSTADVRRAGRTVDVTVSIPVETLRPLAAGD